LPWSRAEELVLIPHGYGSDVVERTCLASLLGEPFDAALLWRLLGDMPLGLEALDPPPY
jgi:hypothetical protein